MVATGPYTTAENMLYWPLTALLETVEQKRPDVLVLAGPFVDHKHKDVCLGNVSTTFEAQYGTLPLAFVLSHAIPSRTQH
jgi:DNA polymerase alpha subunit B